MTLAETLKELREKKGKNYREAAEEMGISHNYLWELENGKRSNPSKSRLQKLCDYYGEPMRQYMLDSFNLKD